MNQILDMHSVVGALVFSTVGLVMFVVGFFVFDKITPYSLWKEIIEEQNVALAIVVGTVSLGLCFIIGAAIH